MLEGPVDAQGTDLYRYPPPLAQALVPLTVLSVEAAAWVWAGVQAGCLVVALLLVGLPRPADAGSAAGRMRALERVAWMLAASACLLPVFDSLWKGNVDLVLALMIASAASAWIAPDPSREAGPAALEPGPRQGIAAATATVLKVSPATLLVPIAAAAISTRRSRPLLGAAVAGVVIVGLSALLASGVVVTEGFAAPPIASAGGFALGAAILAGLVPLEAARPAP